MTYKNICMKLLRIRHDLSEAKYGKNRLTRIGRIKLIKHLRQLASDLSVKW